MRKLEFLREDGSDKHARDIRFILAATAVDSAYLEAEIARLGLSEQWRACDARALSSQAQRMQRPFAC